MVKNLLAIQKTWVQSPGQEDSLEKELAIYSCVLAWRIIWTQEPVGYRPWGHIESDTTLKNSSSSIADS